MKYTVPQIRKFVAAAVGAAAVVASELLALGDVIDPAIGRWATVIVAVATALGVYGIENEPTPQQVEKVQKDAVQVDDENAVVADPAVVDRILKGAR